MVLFNEGDRIQVSSKGIDPETIEKQISHFRTGFPYILLDRPAVPGDGILTFSPGEAEGISDYFDREHENLRVTKFVPASGAASRMFKHLYEFREGLTKERKLTGSKNGEAGFDTPEYFFTNIERFAFYEDLEAVMRTEGSDIAESLKTDPGKVIRYLLDGEGLDYGGLPKALILFHRYPDGARTAAEEHLVEAAHYAKNRDLSARVHFTLSQEHIGKFFGMIDKVRNKYETLLGTRFNIGHSIQHPSTDTIAVDENNNVFRNPDGSLLFRPGGHGALLRNLNELDADLVFIKNIDNIVPDRLKHETYRFKKLIGGYLLRIRNRIHGFLRLMEDRKATAGDIADAVTFARDELHAVLPRDFHSMGESGQVKILRETLDRPIRVCGMVRNEGEPGGGPFWVSASDGSCSLQIVESSQVNPKDDRQKEIFAAATHFNPVDLACCIKNFRGEKFDLNQFVDEETGLISLKSTGGVVIKAMELPGLWNGAMAKWITLFAEVPIITFNPVKTVNDLLRKEHQSL